MHILVYGADGSIVSTMVGYDGDARCVEALLPLHDPVPHIRRAIVEITTPVQLDRVALLIEIGINDPNPKLKQLVGDLRDHMSDPRARHALEKIVDTERDRALVTVAQRALAGVVRS